jgi:NAD-dependent SIR2 family protein deacetylase
MALAATPNAAHRALAALDRAIPERFLCLTQNVDGLSQRAGHSTATLRALHGSLLDIRCSECEYHDDNGTASSPAPAPAPAADVFSSDTPLAAPPRCPECAALLRPGVVWFGEPLDERVLTEADEWVDTGVDVVLVVGTSAQVVPAAGYVRQARSRGAVVAVVNPDRAAAEGLRRRDFFFEGDAAELLPVLVGHLAS